MAENPNNPNQDWKPNQDQGQGNQPRTPDHPGRPNRDIPQADRDRGLGSGTPQNPGQGRTQREDQNP